MLEAFIVMLKNVLVFVLLAVPGYLLVKLGIIKGKETGALSKVLMYMGMPFLVLSSTLNISFSGELTKNILIVGAVGVVFNVGIFFLSALFISKKDEAKKQGMARFCMVFSNNGFLGIPLAKAVFGESPVLTYLIILNIITNLVMFTFGIYLVTGDKKRISVKKALLTPVLIAFVLGIILNLINATKYVPEVGTYSTHFSNVVTALSMTILGIKMAEVKLGSIFTKGKTYWVSAVKLVIVPALIVAIMFVGKFVCPVNADMIIGSFIAFAMPTAGLASTFAEQYDGDAENAVAFTLGTTLFCILTIPALYGLLLLLV